MLDRKPKRFWYILGALVCLSILLIGLRGRLTYYIHPRYSAFTLLTCTVGFFILTKASFTYNYKGKQTIIQYESLPELLGIFIKWLLSKSTWLVVITIALLIWAPSRPLLSGAANRRQQTLTITPELKMSLMDEAWFENPTTLEQFSMLSAFSEGQKVLSSKNFELVGFVQEDQSGANDIFLLSRFLVTCCAIDATPNSIKVYAEDWRGKFSTDSWVHITGSFMALQTSQGQQFVLNGNIKSIPQPKEPYDYAEIY